MGISSCYSQSDVVVAPAGEHEGSREAGRTGSDDHDGTLQHWPLRLFLCCNTNTIGAGMLRGGC